VVHLQRGVADRVLLLQQPLQLVPGGVAVPVPVDQHVRRQRRLRRGDQPDVQVVHLGDAVHAGQPGTHLGRVDPRRRGFQQDPPGRADQRHAGLDQQRRDHERGQPVGPDEPGQHDHQPGQPGGEERVQISYQVPERPLHVEAAPPGPGHQPARRHAHHDPGQRGHQDSGTGDRRRVHQPAYRLDRQRDREQQQGQPVGLGGEDLGPLQPVGEPAPRRSLRQPRHDQREDQRPGVGDQVGGVGQQGQRPGQQPDHDLGRHERDDQRQSTGQVPPVAADRPPVPMAVLVRHTVNVGGPAARFKR